ncbi:MAG: glycosyltransferase family 2 protein [Acidimicrobiales bacterium]|nr:glycosyltransferase family 2 protein [Acidimicrobiales bacterium]
MTIAIPNWNHRGFLPRSIRSARAAIASMREAGFPGEVLVIDDASRDGSGSFLRSLDGMYGWDDVSVLLQAENGGLAAVRNRALELTRFSHVLFLDADNEVLPSGVVTLFRAAIDTGAAYCYGNLLDVCEGEVVGIRSNEGPTLRLTATNYIDALALVDGQRALAIGGYSVDPRSAMAYWEDWEFVLHLIAEESELVFVPTIVGNYYVLPLSMLTDSKNAEHAERDLRTIRRIYAQTGTREWDPERIGRVYHPDIGYLDEGWLIDGA